MRALNRPNLLIALALIFSLWSLGSEPALAKSSRKSKSTEVNVNVESPAPTISPTVTRSLNQTFKQLGSIESLALRGIRGESSIPFSVRSDELVLSAKLKLNYSYSPSLIPEISHIQVILNDQVIGLIPVPKEAPLINQREIAIDPRYFTDFNKLTFRLIGHYTYRCEDPLHTSLWANVSNLSTLELKLAPLPLANDLRILPLPFFDRRDDKPLQLPFVFTSEPTPEILKPAGVMASWFGRLADYRGAHFPVYKNELPETNAVIFSLNGQLPAGLVGNVSLPSSGPAISMVNNPMREGTKLLIISGHSTEDLMQAAQTVVLNDATLSGQQVGILKFDEPPRRKPYDAPAWVPVDRAVRFGEFMRQDQLQVRGYFPPSIYMNFRVTPDLFTWRSDGAPVDLKFRYTELMLNKNSSLNLSLNDGLINAIPLNSEAQDNFYKKAQKQVAALTGTSLDWAVREQLIHLPPYLLYARNQLKMHYFFEIAKEGECKDNIPDNMEGAIDQESTFDFSMFPHYVAMPNLAHFSSLGFPFTRMADLSDTAVVLPEKPTSREISSYLDVMGHLGESSGYPALRHHVVSSDHLPEAAGLDLIVIGNKSNLPFLANWANKMPIVTQQNGTQQIRTPSMWDRIRYRWEENDLITLERPDGEVVLRKNGPIAALIGFESPLAKERSVVVLYADADADQKSLTSALRDPELRGKIRGDFTVVYDKDAEHFRLGDTYYLGSMPWHYRIRWVMAHHPILTAIVAFIVIFFLAAGLYRVLRRVAALRLKGQ